MKRKPETLNSKKFDLVGFLLEYNSYVILIALIVISAILSPYFFTKGNLCNLARQYSMYFLLTIGILFVIFTGSIDLSLGSTIGFGGILFGICLEYWGWNSWGVGGFLASLAVALVGGAAVGCINGLLVAKLNVDESPAMPSKYGIRAIQTLILFKNGEIVEQVTGAVSKANIVTMIEQKALA